jgi:hypothetical protein
VQTSPASSRWGGARRLKRVFSLDLECCPRCHQGALRLIAAITSGPIIRRILSHLKLAADPRPWPRPAWSRAGSPGPRSGSLVMTRCWGLLPQVFPSRPVFFAGPEFIIDE